jgi:hypothetical protein
VTKITKIIGYWLEPASAVSAGIYELLELNWEERERLDKSRFVPKVDPEIIMDYKVLGERYRHTLETSEDFTFWRGLVDDLDVTGIIGVDEMHRRYIDFVVFGRVRKGILGS